MMTSTGLTGHAIAARDALEGGDIFLQRPFTFYATERANIGNPDHTVYLKGGHNDYYVVGRRVIVCVSRFFSGDSWRVITYRHRVDATEAMDRLRRSDNPRDLEVMLQPVPGIR